jgi:DNA polymerase III alpha subunit
MTKSRSKKEFTIIRNDFINGTLKNGFTHNQAETVWKFLTQFVGYGFNKAHSATYGTIAFQTAFLKYYFPLEYMCAVLNNQGGFYSRMAYIEEARRLGIPFLPPDIHYSQRDFSCENNTIRTGLSPVFELTRRTIERILNERKKNRFRDLYDFISRTGAGEKETSHLIKCGALQSLHASAPQLLLLNKIYFKTKKKKTLTEFITGNTVLQPYNDYQKILNEMEMLDFAVTAHPLKLFEQQIEWDEMVPSNRLEYYREKKIKFCGWLVTTRRVITSNKQYMKFLTLEDYHGLCEAVLFSETYKKYGHLIHTHGPYIINGKVQSRLPGEANIIIEKIELVEMRKGELETLLQKKYVIHSEDFSPEETGEMENGAGE